jgi:hypothetical protein
MMAGDPLDDCIGFNWDESNTAKNLESHKVTPEEAEDIFFQYPLVVRGDAGHSSSERRFRALGRTLRGRRLLVACTVRRKLIRVISARDMNRREAEEYKRREEDS